MDLKEYIQILKSNKKVFWGVTATVVVLAFAIFFLRPISYMTSLTLNITRSGSQQTSDYKFDDFYRLQADEKFTETVVEWLKSPRTAENILKNAGLDTSKLSLRQFSKTFSAEKLSSQLVAVSFSSPNFSQAQKVSASLSNEISKNIEALNKDQQESGWFEVVAHEPVIVKTAYDPVVIFLASLLVGIFIAFWTVLIIHYLK